MKSGNLSITSSQPEAHRHHHVKTKNIDAGSNALDARQPIFYNGDVFISTARPTKGMDFFFRNGQGDELYFLHQGKAALESFFGHLQFHEIDFIPSPLHPTYP